MKKIIENLENLISSIKFVEQEEGSSYIISDTDVALLNEALNEALQIHNVMQAEGSASAMGAAVASEGQGEANTCADCGGTGYLKGKIHGFNLCKCHPFHGV